jgi:hypothetical protein
MLVVPGDHPGTRPLLAATSIREYCMSRRLIGPLLAALALAPLTTAAAQNPHTRNGFWFNGGLGVGSYGCDGCSGRESGGSATIGIGGTLSSKVLLGAGINVWAKEINGVDLTAGTVTAMIRFYPSATGGFFLVGGLGYATEQVSAGNVSVSESGAGVLLGLGLDLRVGKNISLTPFWNGNGLSIDGASSNFGQLGLSLTIH